MKRLIIQTYTTNDVERTSAHTYRPNTPLEKASQKSMRLYANAIGADYELFTGSTDWEDTHPGAHWHRMIMFHRPEYDEVLYVDCDVVVNPMMLTPDTKENIFEFEGNGVYSIHPSAERKIGWPGGINCGVMKFTREEAEVMKNEINNYYHPTTNQEALNNCWRDHIGMPKLLSARWNITHLPEFPFAGYTNFRHFPGGQRARLDQDAIYNHWKDQMRNKGVPYIKRLRAMGYQI